MTLTETAYWTKRLAVVIGGFLAVAVISLYIFLKKENQVTPPKEYIYPQNTCTATREEFLSNQLEIPSLDIKPDVRPTFSIETPTGQFNAMPGIVNVYRFETLTQLLTAVNKAKSIADTLGFDPDSLVRPDSRHYSWEKDTPNQTLLVEARTLHFSFQTDFTDPKYPINQQTAPTVDTAYRTASKVMREIGLISEDYLKENYSYKLIKIEPDGSFSEAKSQVEANLIRIDYNRSVPAIAIDKRTKDANKLLEAYANQFLKYREDTIGGRDYYLFISQVVTEDTQKSNVSVYVGTDPKSKRAKVYQIDFNNWYIEDLPCGTYALISPTQAFDKIQKGQGSLVYLNIKDGDTVVPYTPRAVQAFNVYNVFLAYYDSSQEQKFLQPIYIFSGEAIFADGLKGNFYFYVPAINYEIVQDAPTQQTTLSQ